MKHIPTITLAIGAAMFGTSFGISTRADDGELRTGEERHREYATVDLSVYDLDGDGSISREEYDAAGGLFDLLDRDGDEQLSARELGMLAGRRPRDHRGPGGLFMRADADGDRVVSAAEWEAFLTALDPDGDGEVRRPGRGGADSCSQRRPGADRLDPDGDCVIQLADMRKLFTALDVNGDGELTRDELPHPARDRQERDDRPRE